MSTIEAPVVSAAVLLDRAQAAGRALVAGDLTDLALLAERFVAAIGRDHLLDRIPAGVERVVLGHLDHGPLLALRRYAADEQSSVHSHAWTVLVQLDGEAVFDRWQLTENGRVTRTERRALQPGSITLIGDGEPHRQWARTDMVELVVMARYDEEVPKVECEAMES